MDNHEEVIKLFHQLPITKMPVGYYLLDADGDLIECNIHARELLDLPPEGKLQSSIMELLIDPGQQEELLLEVQEAEIRGKLHEGIIHLWIKDQEKIFRESICVLRNQESKDIIGYYGYIIDVTNEQRNSQLFTHLTVGIYRLDSNDNIIEANNNFIHLLGYNSIEEIINKPARQFYANPDDEKRFKEEIIQKQGNVVHKVVELLKKNGEFIFTRISSRAIIKHNIYLGREGTISDITKEENYRTSLEGAPVGYYLVRNENGIDRIRHFNKYFMEMFKFKDDHQIYGFEIKKLYANPDDYKKFMQTMQEMDSHGQAVQYDLKVKDLEGQAFDIEIHSRYIKDVDGKILGRTGVVFNISKQVQFREQLEDLQGDIGRLLHSYSSTLITTRHQIKTAIEALSPSPFILGKYILWEDIEKELDKPVSNLLTHMGNFLQTVENNWQDRGIRNEEWVLLQRWYHLFIDYNNEIPYQEFRVHTIQRTCRLLIKLCERIKESKVSKESVKEIVQSAKEVERIACLSGLHQIDADIVAMDHDVSVFRDVITGGVRAEPTLTVIPVWHIVGKAMNGLEDFAYAQNVVFKSKDQARGIKVKVDEREMVRAFSNILHNAIKYSWNRMQGEPPWINILVYKKANDVYVEFEDYGVAIPKDEIDSNLVYILGFRGRRSRYKGRPGTGIGLYDSLKTVNSHRGSIMIESKSAKTGKPEDDYDQPFLTKVTIKLPIFNG